jgi:hypothetical protein
MNTIDLKQTLGKEHIWTTSNSVLKELLLNYKLLYVPGTKRERSFIDLIIIKDSQTDPQVNIGKMSSGPPAKIGDMLIDSKVKLIERSSDSQIKHVHKRKHHIKKRDMTVWNTLHESLT